MFCLRLPRKPLQHPVRIGTDRDRIVVVDDDRLDRRLRLEQRIAELPGCIDIGHAEVKWLDRIKAGGKKVKVYVKYNDKEGRMKHHKGSDKWPLIPWSDPKKIGGHRSLTPREMAWGS